MHEKGMNQKWQMKQNNCYRRHGHTHVPVQDPPGAVEEESLLGRVQYHPVVVVVQQGQRDGAARVPGSAVDLHVLDQNRTYGEQKGQQPMVNKMDLIAIRNASDEG